MIGQVKVAFRYLIVMGIGAALLLMTVFVPVISSQADFSIYNQDWNGCSGIARDIYSTGSFLPTIDISESSEDHIAHSRIDELEGIDPERSTIMIIGPELSFNEGEKSYVDGFLKEGGTVFLADDFGTGNDLLSGLDTRSRISGDIMLDLSFNVRGNFSVLADFRDHSITRNISLIITSNPSVIIPGKNAVSIMNSSRSSWIDRDQDERMDDGEEKGPFPLLTIERYGKGLLVLLSDPSILINGLMDVPEMDNSVFVDNLMGFLSRDRDNVVIDESHRDLTNPVHMMGRFLGGFEPIHKIVILLVITTAFILFEIPLRRKFGPAVRKLYSRLGRSREKSPMSGEELYNNIVKKHPEWKENTIRKLIREIEGDT
ncbi:MAG: DUF4350 domain-containing protein [Thermoplasmatota archaeon]